MHTVLVDSFSVTGLGFSLQEKQSLGGDPYQNKHAAPSGGWQHSGIPPVADQQPPKSPGAGFNGYGQ